jgi:hypothetical protein
LEASFRLVVEETLVLRLVVEEAFLPVVEEALVLLVVLLP